MRKMFTKLKCCNISEEKYEISDICDVIWSNAANCALGFLTTLTQYTALCGSQISTIISKFDGIFGQLYRQMLTKLC